VGPNQYEFSIYVGILQLQKLVTYVLEFVLDKETYTIKWKLITSNHPTILLGNQGSWELIEITNTQTVLTYQSTITTFSTFTDVFVSKQVPKTVHEIYTYLKKS